MNTEPRPKRRQSVILQAVRGIAALVTVVGLIALGAAGLVGWNLYQNYASDLPSLEGLRTYQPPVMSRVYAGDDRLIAELAEQRRIFVPIPAVPDIVAKAFLAAEDKDFYHHNGVDPLAIARAAITDLQRIGESRRPVGASTITQQVARNMLLGSNDLTFKRKVKEALLALRIERTLTKQRILELYLNEIYLGQGSYGVAAAAQAYFNKPLDQVTIAQAAMLAALPKSPTNYNPFRDPDAARDRRNWVLDRMVETGAITDAQRREAQAEPIGEDAYRRPETVPGSGWFAGEVKRRLIERFGPDQATEGGLIVHTSLDPRLQGLADDALRRGLLNYARTHGGWRGAPGRITEGVGLHQDWPARLAAYARPPGMLPEWTLAVVLEAKGNEARLGWLDARMNPDSPQPKLATISLSELGWARPVHPDGELGPPPRRITDVMSAGDVVMVEPQGTEGRHGEEKLALRQIPKVEGALVALDPSAGRVLAMSGGWSSDESQFNRATQAQRQPGSSFKPFVYLAAMQDGVSPSSRFLNEPFSLGAWHPNNYEMTTGGPTPLHVALEESLNLVTVRVAQHIGMDAVAHTAIAYHLYDAMPHVLPAALGAVETTVLREAGAYASIEDGGRVVQPTLIDSVQDRDGHVIWRPPGLAIGAGDPNAPPTLYDTRQPVADPASAFQVLKMMEGVILHGTGRGVGVGLDRPIAAKTGTSQNYNDGWFAGFTPDLVVVAWMGFDQPNTLGDKEDGAHTAGPIWHDFVKAALDGVPPHDFRVPDGLRVVRWDCGPHECEDAFKPDQVPGAGGVGGGEQTERDNEDTSSATVTMMDAVPGDGNQPPPAQPAAPAGSGTGVDSGVGGLY